MGVCLVMDEIRLILEPTHAHGKFVDHVILATEGGRGRCVTPPTTTTTTTTTIADAGRGGSRIERHELTTQSLQKCPTTYSLTGGQA